MGAAVVGAGLPAMAAVRLGAIFRGQGRSHKNCKLESRGSIKTPAAPGPPAFLRVRAVPRRACVQLFLVTRP